MQTVAGALSGSYMITQWQRDSNFWYNAGMKFDRKSFITNQGSGEAAKIKFGSFYGDYNGCSWVSIFNALVFMGDSSLPVNIVSELEKRTLLSGTLGVDQITVRDYFRNRTGINGETYRAVYCLSDYDSNAQIGDAAILMYAYSSGAHYIALKWNGTQYEAYNVYSNSVGVTKFDSIEQFLDSNGYTAMGIIVINKGE